MSFLLECLDGINNDGITADDDLDEEERIFMGRRMYIYTKLYLKYSSMISTFVPILFLNLISLLLFLGVSYESYREERQTTVGMPVNNIGDSIYRNLPKKHHVLRKVSDCSHCGALRFQYEGPA